MQNSYHNEIHYFLERRRQTRFIRHYGGPILALGLFVTGLSFVWKAIESHHPQNRTPMESRESLDQARMQQRSQERQQQAGAWKQPAVGQQQVKDHALQASKFSER